MSAEHPTEEERREVAHYRLHRARETLDEARLMLNEGHGNACINRLYYACFYAASALLVLHGHTAKTHSGTQTLFNEHIVNAGLMTNKLAAHYNKLLDERMASDYKDFTAVTAEEARPWLPRAEAFVEAVARQIEKNSQSL